MESWELGTILPSIPYFSMLSDLGKEMFLEEPVLYIYIYIYLYTNIDIQYNTINKKSQPTDTENLVVPRLKKW